MSIRYVTCPKCAHEFDANADGIKARHVQKCDACGLEVDPYTTATFDMTTTEGYRFSVRVCMDCTENERPITTLRELAERARQEHRHGRPVR